MNAAVRPFRGCRWRPIPKETDDEAHVDRDSRVLGRHRQCIDTCTVATGVDHRDDPQPVPRCQPRPGVDRNQSGRVRGSGPDRPRRHGRDGLSTTCRGAGRRDRGEAATSDRVAGGVPADAERGDGIAAVSGSARRSARRPDGARRALLRRGAGAQSQRHDPRARDWEPCRPSTAT